MKTIFRTTATLPDRSGQFRTSILLTGGNAGLWSDAAKADLIRMRQLPTIAIDVSDEEFARLDADHSLLHGYAATSGDLTSDFVPAPWVEGF